MIDDLYEQLAAQFPTEAHKTLERAGGQTYVPWNLVAERLNTVLGLEHWSFRVIREGFTTTECWVLGELSATIRDTETVRQQYGCSPIVQGQRETPVDDLLKKAGTDAFKKCAQVLGVALYLTDADDRAEVKAAMAEAKRPTPLRSTSTPAAATALPRPAPQPEPAPKENARAREMVETPVAGAEVKRPTLIAQLAQNIRAQRELGAEIRMPTGSELQALTDDQLREMVKTTGDALNAAAEGAAAAKQAG